MEQIIQQSPKDEVAFLLENETQSTSFYWKLVQVKYEQIIFCKNIYERRIVHILAHKLGLYHARYGEWNDEYKNYFDYQYKCKLCWSDAGEKYYRIVGVKVSTEPLPLTKKDITHQKICKKLSQQYDSRKK